MFHVKHPPYSRGDGLLHTNYTDVTNSAEQDNNATRRLDALALTPHTLNGRHRVVHDLAFERGHRRELLALTGLQHPAGHLVSQSRQLVATTPAPPRDVQHQPAPLPRLLMHGQPGQLLQRVEHLALATDQFAQIPATVDAH